MGACSMRVHECAGHVRGVPCMFDAAHPAVSRAALPGARRGYGYSRTFGATFQVWPSCCCLSAQLRAQHAHTHAHTPQLLRLVVDMEAAQAQRERACLAAPLPS